MPRTPPFLLYRGIVAVAEGAGGRLTAPDAFFVVVDDALTAFRHSGEWRSQGGRHAKELVYFANCWFISSKCG